MQRWERRLIDLAHILGRCSRVYFDPNLFRLNTNQFLTTARTVTFLIQKGKDSIPSFSNWYEENVIKPWQSDPIMKWAKESRNYIEKEGDLELHSHLSVSLIFSYFENEDIVLTCDRIQIVRANIKRLIRFAEKFLPTGIADVAILKIQRRWVANTLPSHELLYALIYIYSRIREVAASLSKHLGSSLHQAVPEPTDFDEGLNDDMHIRYVKFSDRHPGLIKTERMRKDPNYTPPAWLKNLAASRDETGPLTSLPECVKLHAEVAKGTFEQFGNHIPMLFLFDSQGKVIDYLGATFEDQATKYIFWRKVADRITYLHATSLIWVSEAWIRDMVNYPVLPMRKLPIKGEMLQVIGLDISGHVEAVYWNINRQSQNAKPTLSIAEDPFNPDAKPRQPFFLEPARRAFERLRKTDR